VVVQQIAVDAFGSALGNSIVDQADPEKARAMIQEGNGFDVADDAARVAAHGVKPAQQITEAQLKAMRAGLGPLSAEAAQVWAEAEDQVIGPAANGHVVKPTKEQIAARAELRARIQQTASEFWNGTGAFAPTTADNQTLASALKDTGRAVWNLGVGLGSLAEMADPFDALKRSVFQQNGLSYPRASDFRATYDTPAFGHTVELSAPFVPLSKMLRAPRSLGGAAFLEGKFVHDLKPVSNLELYGKAATRTPEEALQILQRVGHDPEVLAEYRIVKLSDADYQNRRRTLGFDFDATYGNVSGGAHDVRFHRDIASKMGDESTKITVHVRKEVFDSDEAIVQILSHEISETQELKYLAARPISVSNYRDLVRADRVDNLHWRAVQEGDWWLQRFRDSFKGK
jgi:hypothetical protein